MNLDRDLTIAIVDPSTIRQNGVPTAFGLGAQPPSELMSLLLKGELRNSLRLSLLPGLATAVALEQKITDKGIW